MEFVPKSVDLKSYVLKQYASPTPELMRPQCFALGAAIGKWLRHFHDTIMQESKVLEAVKKTEFTQQVKQMINYNWLFERMKTYPDILAGAKDTFEMVSEQNATESKPYVNHGDFWPGKYVHA